MSKAKQTEKMMTPVQEELSEHLTSMMKKVTAIKEHTDELGDLLPDGILAEQLQHVLDHQRNQRTLSHELKHAYIEPFEPGLH